MIEREILVTNDDGIYAPGLHALAQLMRRYGNVTVVAPVETQSGMSSSFSMDRVLRLVETERHPAGCNDVERLGSVRYFSLTGTPVDCAKMGINMLKDEGHMPDFLASGINHGLNASAAAVYSGTLGAAREGALYGIPSVGFSIDSGDDSIDLSAVLEYSVQVVDNVFRYGMKRYTFLNVNFPALPSGQIRGFKAAPQGLGRWEKEFEKRVDPRGREYYWIVGTFVDLEGNSGGKIEMSGDHKLVEQGWISLCPMQVDTTCYEEMDRIRRDWGVK